jgi:hypothetical protein
MRTRRLRLHMRTMDAAVMGAVFGAAVIVGCCTFSFWKGRERFTQTPDLIRGWQWWPPTESAKPTAQAPPAFFAGVAGFAGVADTAPLPQRPPPPLPAAGRPAPPASAPVPAGATSVRILEPHETRELLAADADGYVAGMTKMDLYARRVLQPRQYLSTVSASAGNVLLTPADKRLVAARCQQADAFFARDLARSPAPWAIDGRSVARLPWVLAFTPAAPPSCAPVADVASVPFPVYEDGLPHTRGLLAGGASVVFLPVGFLGWQEEAQVETLVHEKVHVFQRAAPAVASSLVTAPYRSGGRTTYFARHTPRSARPHSSDVRSNPDVDDWFYGECAVPPPSHLVGEALGAWARDNCTPMGVRYGGAAVQGLDDKGNAVSGTDGPNCITDIRGDTPAAREHPFEVMAYDVASAYKRVWEERRRLHAI